ncbi:MAG: hypothetical protein ACK40G_05345 [Cytophagaceae bacterium]
MAKLIISTFLAFLGLFNTYHSHGQVKKSYIIKIDSVENTISKVKLKSKGTGGGYAGNLPDWTKEKKRVYDFQGNLKSKSVIVKWNGGCIVQPVKVKVIEYENGKWVLKRINKRYGKVKKVKNRKAKIPI